VPKYGSERNDLSPLQSTPSGATDPQGFPVGGHSLPALTGQPGQIAWALQIRSQIEQTFGRISAAVSAGTNRYKALEPLETELLLKAVEEHRSRVMGTTDAQYFTDQWQDPLERAQRLIHADFRWLNILEARAARNPKQEPVVPVRYMGFDDAKGIRSFKFGRLPAGAASPVFRVSVPVNLLLSHGISFQDAPSMCAAIMAAKDAEDHLLTEDDCIAFVAMRPVKTDRKPPRRKAPTAETQPAG
jgi:hypothetical protein